MYLLVRGGLRDRSLRHGLSHGALALGEEVNLACQCPVPSWVVRCECCGQIVARLAFLPQAKAISAGLLTNRQRDIVIRLADGKSIKEIAGLLRLSDKTVSYHWQNIKHKLKLYTVAHVARWAVQEGLV